jgi:phosphoenolpyruvate carboxykinase (ATP)
VHAALNGRLAQADFITEEAFGLTIPVACPEVPAQLLNPRNAWADRAAYDTQARRLAAKFVQNFDKFNVPESVRCAGPHG